MYIDLSASLKHHNVETNWTVGSTLSKSQSTQLEK